MLSVIYAVSFMLGVTNKPSMLSAIVMNVIMLSVIILSEVEMSTEYSVLSKLSTE
jgi:hypothetical protein